MPRRSESEEVHDVLVPEEFPIGTADADTPEARAHRIAPPDPSGGQDTPHDVLVPEEFPIGTADAPPSPPEDDGGRPFVAAGLAALGAAVAALVLRRRRS